MTETVAPVASTASLTVFEYGDAERRLSRLAGGDAGDNLRAVFEHLLRVEHRRCTGDALDDDFGVLINQN